MEGSDRKRHSDGAVPLDDHEKGQFRQSIRLRAAVIYEIVRHEGDRDLKRPGASLFWSGVAAGLSIAFSLVAEGALRAGLPEAAWRPLVTSWGYTVGFLIVVLGRQQLFTETTITAVLPVMAEPSVAKFGLLLRLWAIVLASNIAGTLSFAALVAYAPVLPSPLSDGMFEVARHAMDLDANQMFWSGIIAGWLVAAMVWLLPGAEGNPVPVILVMTYVIGLSGSSHVIVGSTEAGLLLFSGELGLAGAIFGFFLPTLAGNVVGGSALFALVSYAQVQPEILEGRD